ncbi:MAG: hypothetical protein A4E57_00781 [Syntrophorhabdaceae bacterium PtaU1.Bin034]|nr:MAG: hypothetical protein A4E57_00781 [Syntrophorhabdaceae bacterium PtaU1.Bin034]
MRGCEEARKRKGEMNGKAKGETKNKKSSFSPPATLDKNG